MANTRSQMKRNRQNAKRRMRNRSVKSEILTREKAAFDVAAAGEDATEALRLAQKRVDSAAARGVIHKNTAARRKSRLAREIARLNEG